MLIERIKLRYWKVNVQRKGRGDPVEGHQDPKPKLQTASNLAGSFEHSLISRLTIVSIPLEIGTVNMLHICNPIKKEKAKMTGVKVPSLL
jgi:hypothetical protein